MPNSGENGSTLQVLPVNSNIKASSPNTTMFAWLSSSEVELSLLCGVRDKIIAFMICLLGIITFKLCFILGVFMLCFVPFVTPADEICQSFLFLRMLLSFIFVAGEAEVSVADGSLASTKLAATNVVAVVVAVNST